jgi:hypothetical protein
MSKITGWTCLSEHCLNSHVWLVNADSAYNSVILWYSSDMMLVSCNMTVIWYCYIGIWQLYEGGLKKLTTTRYPAYPVMSYSVSHTGYVVGYVVQAPPSEACFARRPRRAGVLPALRSEGSYGQELFFLQLSFNFVLADFLQRQSLILMIPTIHMILQCLIPSVHLTTIGLYVWEFTVPWI